MASKDTSQKKPNILIIWGDDIGWFNISGNNNGIMGYRTPNIDRVAKEGSFAAGPHQPAHPFPKGESSWRKITNSPWMPTHSPLSAPSWPMRELSWPGCEPPPRSFHSGSRSTNFFNIWWDKAMWF